MPAIEQVELALAHLTQAIAALDRAHADQDLVEAVLGVKMRILRARERAHWREVFTKAAHMEQFCEPRGGKGAA